RPPTNTQFLAWERSSSVSNAPLPHRQSSTRPWRSIIPSPGRRRLPPSRRPRAPTPPFGVGPWGHALSILENPFAWPATFTPQRLDSVVAALDAGQSAGLKSKPQQAYCPAVGVF